MGRLKRLVAVSSARNRARSVRKNDFINPKFTTFESGPAITPRAEVPKEPGCGGAKALTSNHLRVDWSPAGRFASRKWSGRSVTLGAVALDVKAIPTGSGPVQAGVRNWPE